MGALSWLGFLSGKAFGLDLSALVEHTPRLSLPFKLEKGYVLTTDFKAGGNLKKRYRYCFELSFLIKDLSQKTRTDLARLWGTIDASGNSLVGFAGNSEGSYIESDGTFRSGIPVPLKLQIYQLADNHQNLIFAKEYSKLSGGGTELRGIDGLFLDPGSYKIELESLSSIPELEKYPVNFEIRVAGK